MGSYPHFGGISPSTFERDTFLARRAQGASDLPPGAATAKSWEPISFLTSQPHRHPARSNLSRRKGKGRAASHSDADGHRPSLDESIESIDEEDSVNEQASDSTRGRQRDRRKRQPTDRTTEEESCQPWDESTPPRLQIAQTDSSPNLRSIAAWTGSNGSAAREVPSESTPLLVSDSTPLLAAKSEEYSHIKGLAPLGTPLAEMRWPEAYLVARAARSISITHLLEYSLAASSLFMIGHLGVTELAAASLAAITFNVVALSITQGMAGSLDTLCPQAFAASPKDTSLHALRASVLLLIIMIPQVLVLCLVAEPLFVVLRQDPEVARLAAVYLRIQCLGLPGLAGFEVIRRYLQAQSLMLAPALCVGIVAPLNAVLCYLLILGPPGVQIGFVGAPVAFAIMTTLLFASSLVYCVFFVSRDAWGGLSSEALRDFGEVLSLGSASVAMTASETWCWEAVSLLSSVLGKKYLAAQSIAILTASTTYQIPLALNVSASVRIGNLLGANRPDLARMSSQVSLLLATAVGLVTSIVLVANRGWWGRLFNNDEQVVKLVAAVLPLVSLFQVADCVTGVCGGILKGGGRPAISAYINLLCYAMLGVPFGAFLCFGPAHLKLVGLWSGLLTALICTACVSTYFVLRFDWELQASLLFEESDEEDEGSQTSTGTAPLARGEAGAIPMTSSSDASMDPVSSSPSSQGGRRRHRNDHSSKYARAALSADADLRKTKLLEQVAQRARLQRQTVFARSRAGLQGSDAMNEDEEDPFVGDISKEDEAVVNRMLKREWLRFQATMEDDWDRQAGSVDPVESLDDDGKLTDEALSYEILQDADLADRFELYLAGVDAASQETIKPSQQLDISQLIARQPCPNCRHHQLDLREGYGGCDSCSWSVSLASGQSALDAFAMHASTSEHEPLLTFSPHVGTLVVCSHCSETLVAS
ncbi:uncharacterized protein L969DRAFT_91547 [Mixia osmundae IAM 14324]|uniref:Uncharacterized protein n=1 Tax=Mixia osmundae (strain CBS 9802 / IAM 14324 / JCM 22182 / KY 12970) TaxID=764103 RepID=G7DV83_MIXOS|nr:uncharacterized protein L969DRAFT_91547 [Mixia osmundae IAM 14324]KEI42083.1 hypothetical protein L969DRAFT_91547 [Mixia osmundae IAM 14324]GAA94493.1 hypothetical protein E5Q_01145 [Mixia osmundae IAM 14324]